MNLFAVHEDPIEAARALSDRHVVKMTLECAQILCTAARSLGQWAPYLPTHVKHPCVLWAGARRANWNWVVMHGLALAEEYERRYGRVHGSLPVLLWALLPEVGPRPSSHPRAPFAQAMPDHHKGPDAVAAYRRFYLAEKAGFATWRAPAQPPAWWPPASSRRATLAHGRAKERRNARVADAGGALRPADARGRRRG